MTTDSIDEDAGKQLRSLIERIERLESDKRDLQDDVREVFAEAKGTGFDVRAMKTILRMRKKRPDDRAEEEAILELYVNALGME